MDTELFENLYERVKRAVLKKLLDVEDLPERDAPQPDDSLVAVCSVSGTRQRQRISIDDLQKSLEPSGSLSLSYVQSLDKESLAGLGDIDIKSSSDGDIIQRSGEGWKNVTLNDAGIPGPNHTHRDLSTKVALKQLSHSINASLRELTRLLEDHKHDELYERREVIDVALEHLKDALGHASEVSGALDERLKAHVALSRSDLNMSISSIERQMSDLTQKVDNHLHDAGDITDGVMGYKRGGVQKDISKATGFLFLDGETTQILSLDQLKKKLSG